MIRQLEKDNALEHISDLFKMLSVTGYVKRPAITRMLVYSFLIDFIDVMYPYITDADYKEIECVLSKIFGQGCCLMPYDSYKNRQKGLVASAYGLPYYTGRTYRIKYTENSNPRVTEQIQSRRI